MYKDLPKKFVNANNKIVNINGARYLFTSPFTILELLVYLGFNMNVIVIDYNGSILQKSLWKQIYLKNEDNLEILSIAGGG